MPRLLVLPARTSVIPDDGGEVAILDPARAPDMPGSVALVRNGRTVVQRYVGVNDPTRLPHVWLGLVAEVADRAGGDATFLLPPIAPTVRGRETVDALLRIVRPASALVGPEAWRRGWGIPTERLADGAAPIDAADRIARTARWLRIVDAPYVRRIDLRSDRVIGSVLGARLVGDSERDRAKIGSEEFAAIDGSRLHTVGSGWPTESESERATLAVRAGRHVPHRPDEFIGLIGVLERGRDEVGHVRLERIEPDALFMRSTADLETPYDRLRFGELRVDGSGREITR